MNYKEKKEILYSLFLFQAETLLLYATHALYRERLASQYI